MMKANKMKINKVMTCAVASFVIAGAAFGAGFGLYESSARGNAMGGGLVGSTGDASANYYNPANLTECTNISVMVGISLINPFADAKVNGVQQAKMNAGWFPPPHAYLAVPIMKDLVFGFGTYCEYGLGTKYDNNWAMQWDTTETTIEQFTFNPNLAYKITDWWSIGIGARMSYITFENYKNPLVGMNAGAPIFGRTHLKGDDFNCGWLLSTQFKLTDDLSLGAIYRSRISHTIKGDMDLTTPAGGISGGAHADLELPASATVGLNYDITKKFRSGVALTWTEWSTIDTINFNLPTGVNPLDLKWDDAWRVGFGFEYDITDDFCGRIGYTYDLDPSHKNHGTTMLPPGDRHIIGFGIGYKILDNLRIDLGYNFIIMESTTRNMHMEIPGLGQIPYKFQTDNAYSHIASVSLSYSF
jgi:long-chain fatty acid transport protein